MENLVLFESLVNLLKVNKNIILTGAPGTGKTHLAKNIAESMTQIPAHNNSKHITSKDITSTLKQGITVSGRNEYQIDKILDSKVYISREGIKNKEIPFNQIITAYQNKLWEKGKVKNGLDTYTAVLAKYIYTSKQDNNDSNFSKNKLTELIQFHPSYDYTDFVEGLRPVQNNDSENIYFERKDGTFKSFCKKAEDNLRKSQKTKENLQKECSILNKINEFISSAIDNNRVFETKTKSQFYLLDRTDKFLYIEIPKNDKTSKLTLSIAEIFELLDKNVSLKNVNDIRFHFNRKSNLQKDSYIYTLCNALKDIETEYTEKVIESIPRNNFIFIIDEINRGEVSKIFGELFYAVDPGYRGEKGQVKTQYSNLIEKGDVFENGFYVPENVYIIGTMNDIDRSVESMDFAFRRRFAWKEITVEDTLDEITSCIDIIDWKNEAIKRLRNLNKVIENDENLGRAYCIGGSYLLKLNNFKELTNSNDAFTMLWNYHIKNVLFEYLRGFPNDEIKEKMSIFTKSFGITEK